MTVWAEILYPGGTQRKHKEPKYPVVKFSSGRLFQESIPTPLPWAVARKRLILWGIEGSVRSVPLFSPCSGKEVTGITCFYPFMCAHDLAS